MLPQLLVRASPRLVLLVGIALAALGLLIVARPLTSLLLLGIYVGTSAIVSGVVELTSAHRSPAWWTRALAVAWIALGLAVLIWLGRSLDLLPAALAVLLVLGGLVSISEAFEGGVLSERALTGAWGGAQIAFGALSLAWPDVTVLLVALAFGVRTLVFGVSLVVRGVRGIIRRSPDAASVAPGLPARGRARRISTAVGRWALSMLLIVTAGAGWWLNDWLADGAPVVDAFYSPPDVLPAGHGQLIRTDAYLGRTPPDGRAERMLYTTTDANGRAVAASGLIIFPADAPAGPRPVVLWNHGTTGVAQGCAPSLQEDTATKWAIPALDEAIAHGWVVVAPDYAGQGAPGVFPYLIGKGEARSALDAVMAAGQVDELSVSRDVVVWGHSQGGHAALFSAQIARDYAPELRVLGVAALAPAADPSALAKQLATGRSSALLSVLISWVLVPYSETYYDVRLTDYVAPGGRSIVREMAQRCPSEPGTIVSVAAALGVSEDTPLYIADLTEGALGARLRQNAVAGPFDAPLLIAWGEKDEVIPPALQQKFVAEMCTQGDAVRWYSYRGLDHRGVLMPRSPFLSLLTYWTDDRFENRPAPVDDCRR